MGKTRDLFKKMRDTKGTFHAKMGLIKDRSGMDLTADQLRQHIKKQRHYFANNVRLVKAMVFPVVMYGCESWTIKKAEHRRADALNFHVREDS